MPALRTLAVSLSLCFAGAPAAQEPHPPSRGQTVYVPVYSEILHGDVKRDGKVTRQLLSIQVSIRNTDPRAALTVSSAQYYNSDGRMLRDFVAAPRSVPPLGAIDLFVERSESQGGAGASFVIKWASPAPVSPPLVEAVHVDLLSLRPVSFTTRGRPIAPRD